MKALVSERQIANETRSSGKPAGIKRNVNGVLLLDKPVGMTSNQALQTVKAIYKARKAGHTGSLDPLASGLLPICFGEATKISGFLLDADKEYAVECKLGARTDTGDAEGRILETGTVPTLDRDYILKVFSRFHGGITQIPPMYSAIKHQGQRLYDLAREGIVVPREPRKIFIHALELSGYSNDSLAFNVRCSKGTYVRTLAEDVARELGCLAYVNALRRISVGEYRSMYSLDEVRHFSQIGFSALDNLLMPIDS
ncbi:MAG: tRNA pseudouridine(55) synthase TruB, partial [Gammaproteobacteria bacterium]|nr:tRNA pseudouridine(55) synthase TruB [Gammaproteobacteria bacterium]